MSPENKFFASKLGSVDEAPAAFREAMTQHCLAWQNARLVAYSPSFTTLGHRLPATVLAVNGDRWLVASDDAQGKVHVDDCRFDDTLLLELTTILLYGQLRIDFISGDGPKSSLVYFNTVMSKLYRKAVGLILGSVDGSIDRPAAACDDVAASEVKRWPIHFSNAVPDGIVNGQQLLAVAQWPAVTSGFRRELAPAAALLATDREIVLISDEQSWDTDTETKYGTVITHFPLIRLAKYELNSNERFTILALEMHASHGGEKLETIVPSRNAGSIRGVMDRAMQWRAQ
jgi:hypothetical protein